MQLLKSTTPVMTRPANATAYTAGDLVANSTSFGSVINRILKERHIQFNSACFTV